LVGSGRSALASHPSNKFSLSKREGKEERESCINRERERERERESKRGIEIEGERERETLREREREREEEREIVRESV